jgi:hypothetical protein
MSATQSNLSTEQPAAAAPEERLAAGVLDQAARDLRRFQTSTSGAGHELYVDAHHWITSDDISWPYSFVNVCESLHVSSEMMRADLLGEVPSGGRSHWIRLRERLSDVVRASLIAFSPGHATQTENP